jgi:DNA-binding MarR family transcriptional regulator
VASSCAAANIRRASRVVSQLFAQALAPVDLEGTQFTVLIAAGATGGVPLSNLAEVLVMDRTTLSRNLKPLQRRGLVAVEPGEDRRVRLVSLTPAGRELLRRALPLWQRAQERLVTALGRGRFDALFRELHALVPLVRKA